MAVAGEKCVRSDNTLSKGETVAEEKFGNPGTARARQAETGEKTDDKEVGGRTGDWPCAWIRTERAQRPEREMPKRNQTATSFAARGSTASGYTFISGESVGNFADVIYGS